MSESKAYVPLAATAVACSLAVLFWKRRRGQTEQKQLHSDDVVVNLLPVEQTLAMGGGGDNALSTLTWFQGDYRRAGALLQERANTILQENPWLGGRVVKRKGTFALVYRPSDLRLEHHFQILNDNDTIQTTRLSREVPLDQLGATLSHMLLKTGPTQPLWRVSVIPCQTNPETVFAVVFSMSHIIADGATFYKVQNMLQFAEPVQALTAARIPTTQEQQIRAMGGHAEYSILQSPGFIANCVGGVLKSMLWGPKATSRIFLIDEEGMKAAKQKAVKDFENVPFVSTNDALTSWFCQKTNCQHGLMALNFRGRLEGHTDQLAGNYENVLFYQRQDSESPGLIRQSLNGLRRVVTREEPMPTFAEMATGSVAMATNWSSFAKPSALEGCQEDLQIPLYNIESLLPSTLSIMLIFRAGPKGLAVYLAGTPDKLAGLVDAPFLLNQALQ